MKLWYIWGLYLPVLLIEADNFDKALEEARKINPNYNTGQLRERRLTKQEFIEKAIQNGVDNDSKNVWVVVDGYKYTTPIDDELDYNDEDQPYMASYYLETYHDSSAWDDLYEQYCCREGIKVC